MLNGGNICLTRYTRSGTGLADNVVPLQHGLRRNLAYAVTDSITTNRAPTVGGRVTLAVRVSGLRTLRRSARGTLAVNRNLCLTAGKPNHFCNQANDFRANCTFSTLIVRVSSVRNLRQAPFRGLRRFVCSNSSHGVVTHCMSKRLIIHN